MLRRGGDISAVFAFDEAHSDSDFAAVSGYSSRRQALRSSTARRGPGRCWTRDTASAELVAASVCAKHIVWARDLAFMGFPQTLYIDNRATVALAHNPMPFSTESTGGG